MAKDLGKVCMVPMGEYNNDAQYEVLDLVMKDGALWCAKKDTRGNAPAEGEYWFLASKGAYLMAKEAGYDGSEAEFNEAIGAVAGVVARAESDHARAEGDHSRAEEDHVTAGGDHTAAGADHLLAEGDHTRAESDHTTAEGDHTRAEEDHTTAARDHEAVDGFATDIANKVSKNAPEGEDGAYVIVLDAEGKEWRVPKATMVSLMADGIKAVANEQAKVTFGATTMAELAASMANLMGNPIGKKITLPLSGNLDALTNNGIYVTPVGSSYENMPIGKSSSSYTIVVENDYLGNISQCVYDNLCDVFIRRYDNTYDHIWTPWQRIDNFGANSLAELGTKMYGAGDIAGLAGKVAENTKLSDIFGNFKTQVSTLEELNALPSGNDVIAGIKIPVLHNFESYGNVWTFRNYSGSSAYQLIVTIYGCAYRTLVQNVWSDFVKL